MSVSEPMTMATDYGLAALCALFAWRLWRVDPGSAQASVRCWAAGLACLGVASLAGGTFHGFSMSLSQAMLKGLWKLTVYVIGFASFFLFAGTLRASVEACVRRWLILLPCVQLLVYALWMMHHDEFRYVIYDYAFTNLAVLALQLYSGLTHKEGSAPWLVGGVLVSFIAAAIQMSGLSLHRSFNANDLYHVIQMGGTYCLYRGARLLKDR